MDDRVKEEQLFAGRVRGARGRKGSHRLHGLPAQVPGNRDRLGPIEKFLEKHHVSGQDAHRLQDDEGDRNPDAGEEEAPGVGHPDMVHLAQEVHVEDIRQDRP